MEMHKNTKNTQTTAKNQTTGTEKDRKILKHPMSNTIRKIVEDIILAVIALLIAVVISVMFNGLHSEDDSPVANTAMEELVCAMTTQTTTMTTMTTMTTTTMATAQKETVPTVAPISITLAEVDSQPWANRIGAKYKVSKNDFVQLCNLVAREYGADFVSVEEKARVAQTVLNRVSSKDFSDTIEKVLAQEGQYGVTLDKKGNPVGLLSRAYYSDRVTESVRQAVLYCLNGYCSETGVFYWGDGRKNHFYNTYKEFKVDYQAFVTKTRS